MSDERLDRRIDEVAQQMTAGQPSSDFRARVIASLDRGPRRVWRPIWIVAPLGTLAVAMIVIIVARPFQGRDRRADSPAIRPSSQAASRAPASPEPDIASSFGPPTAVARIPAANRPETASRSTGRAYRPSDAAAAIDALVPPPLEAAPIGVEALGVDRLPTESIAVPQLDAIAPISIEPLPTDDARPPGGNDRR